MLRELIDYLLDFVRDAGTDSACCEAGDLLEQIDQQQPEQKHQEVTEQGTE